MLRLNIVNYMKKHIQEPRTHHSQHDHGFGGEFYGWFSCKINQNICNAIQFQPHINNIFTGQGNNTIFWGNKHLTVNKTEEPTIHYKVQELQNAENAPQHYWARDCLKSFHGHCVQSKIKYIRKDTIFKCSAYPKLIPIKQMQKMRKRVQNAEAAESNEELPIMSKNK